MTSMNGKCIDLENDPQEMNNVYDDPDYAEVREELHPKIGRISGKELWGFR